MTDIATTDIDNFLSFILEEYGYDFRSYSRNSLNRRLRFGMDRLGIESLSGLKTSLLNNDVNVEDCIQFLTINTTEFFRDAAYFQTFRSKVVPVLKTYPYPRIWIAGCSTGEEVLSYAIILAEEGLLEKTMIYATDLNRANLVKAKSRIYRIDQIQAAALSYAQCGGKLALSEYFETHNNHVVFSKDLIENVFFADHCLATDSSFSEFNFISCRYVLIYFDQKLQIRALNLFADSLAELGILGLGNVEDISIGQLSKSFGAYGKSRGFYRLDPARAG